MLSMFAFAIISTGSCLPLKIPFCSTIFPWFFHSKNSAPRRRRYTASQRDLGAVPNIRKVRFVAKVGED
jgi:hypothetical protein